METYVIPILIGLVLAAVFSFIWASIQRKRILAEEQEARSRAERLVEDAKKSAEARLKEANLEAKETVLQATAEFDRQSRERREELKAVEKRIQQKEESVDRRTQQLESREAQLSGRERSVQDREKNLETREAQIGELIEEQRHRLEQISGLTVEEAKQQLIRGIENEAKLEAAQIIKKIETEANEFGHIKAKRILGTAIQRLASDYVAENTVSVVDLPSDDMKGRIIGREGRSIRALELATGVDLIVDDTPEAVILSGFDPIRREVARISLERLMADGRIHPARIEEVVEKVRVELEEKLFEEGEAAAFSLGITDIHPEVLKLLGRLRYRTS